MICIKDTFYSRTTYSTMIPFSTSMIVYNLCGVNSESKISSLLSKHIQYKTKIMILPFIYMFSSFHKVCTLYTNTNAPLQIQGQQPTIDCPSPKRGDDVARHPHLLNLYHYLLIQLICNCNTNDVLAVSFHLLHLYHYYHHSL